MTPATKMPSTLDLWLPKVWTAITVIFGLFAVGAKDDPDLFGQLKLPAGSIAVITALAALSKGSTNTKQAAQATPDHLADEDGHLDPAKTIGRLVANAYEAGDTELVKALLAVPTGQTGGRR